MEVNWLQVLLTVAILYTALVLERRYRLWRWRRSRKTESGPPVDESTRGLVAGAARPIPCGRCGAIVNKFYEYADGDAWCVRCHEESE